MKFSCSYFFIFLVCVWGPVVYLFLIVNQLLTHWIPSRCHSLVALGIDDDKNFVLWMYNWTLIFFFDTALINARFFSESIQTFSSLNFYLCCFWVQGLFYRVYQGSAQAPLKVPFGNKKSITIIFYKALSPKIQVTTKMLRAIALETINIKVRYQRLVNSS